MRSVFTTTVVLVAGMIGQLALPGPLGTLMIYVMAASFAMATACWSMGVALRARTVQAAPMMQLVVFILVFTSVAYAPRDLQTGWLRTVSNWNPVTRILESRTAEFQTMTWSGLLGAVISIAVLMAVFGAFALHGLSRLRPGHGLRGDKWSQKAYQIRQPLSHFRSEKLLFFRHHFGVFNRCSQAAT